MKSSCSKLPEALPRSYPPVRVLNHKIMFCSCARPAPPGGGGGGGIQGWAPDSMSIAVCMAASGCSGDMGSAVASSDSMGSGRLAAGRPYSSTPCVAVSTAQHPALAAGTAPAMHSLPSTSLLIPAQSVSPHCLIRMAAPQPSYTCGASRF